MHPPISKFDLGLHDGVPGVARTPLGTQVRWYPVAAEEVFDYPKKKSSQRKPCFSFDTFFSFFPQELDPWDDI